MPSKRKTTVDEASSTKKKGITKTNTTRTQKIARKTKATNKHIMPVSRKPKKGSISEAKNMPLYTEFAKALEAINKLTSESIPITEKSENKEELSITFAEALKAINEISGENNSDNKEDISMTFAEALEAINKLSSESNTDNKEDSSMTFAEALKAINEISGENNSDNKEDISMTFAEALDAINKLTGNSNIDTEKEPISENQEEKFMTFAEALEAINELSGENSNEDAITENQIEAFMTFAEALKAINKLSGEIDEDAKETPKRKTQKAVKASHTKTMPSNDDITTNTPLVEDSLSTEYYDLPFTYNKTVVKILAQTPDVLFVYWDIAEEDRKKYIKQYGENFFNETKPVLIITNKTMNYTFEVDINDFANSWYLHVNDAKCEYHIELGRRPISQNVNIPNNYLHVTSSNGIEAPNDHILFEKAQNMIYFRNVKTNVVSSKSITSLSFLKNMGRIYNIYDFYKQIYKDEDFSDSSRLMGNSSSVLK